MKIVEEGKAMFSRLKASVPVFAAGMAVVGPAFACNHYDAAVAAVQSVDRPKAERLYEAIGADPACDDALRNWVGKFLARVSFRDGIQPGAPIAEKREALEMALGYEKHWRSFYELGRLDWDVRDYGAAATNFQLALDELAEGNPSHTASDYEIAELYRLAAASVALADEPVALSSTRSGGPRGILRDRVRGFEVEEVPLPITFEFNSTSFDKAGQLYAEALLEHVLSTEPEVVRLHGHTDPRGDEEYNYSLSVGRAVAVRNFLASNGFKGHVEVRGFGETQVPPPPPGIEPGSNEHFRIARRVTFSSS
jgi:outer membrane protein OmpA-like peptidoglycan-associated protein